MIVHRMIASVSRCGIVAELIKIAKRIIQADDVGVFGVEVEQALGVGRSRAVADSLAHHYRPKSVLAGIDRRGAAAAAGRASRDDQGIDTAGEQLRHQIGAEEARSVFLVEQDVALAEVEARIEFPAVTVGLQADYAFHLARPDTGIPDIGLIVAHGREDDRAAPRMSRRQQWL